MYEKRCSCERDYNCKHRLLVSAACTLSLSLVCHVVEKVFAFQSAPPLGISSLWSLFRARDFSMSICSSSLARDNIKFRTLARDTGLAAIPVRFIFHGIRNAKPIAMGRVYRGIENEYLWFRCVCTCVCVCIWDFGIACVCATGNSKYDSNGTLNYEMSLVPKSVSF